MKPAYNPNVELPEIINSATARYEHYRKRMGIVEAIETTCRDLGIDPDPKQTENAVLDHLWDLAVKTGPEPDIVIEDPEAYFAEPPPKQHRKKMSGPEIE